MVNRRRRELEIGRNIEKAEVMTVYITGRRDLTQLIAPPFYNPEVFHFPLLLTAQFSGDQHNPGFLSGTTSPGRDIVAILAVLTTALGTSYFSFRIPVAGTCSSCIIYTCLEDI